MLADNVAKWSDTCQWFDSRHSHNIRIMHCNPIVVISVSYHMWPPLGRLGSPPTLLWIGPSARPAYQYHERISCSTSILLNLIKRIVPAKLSVSSVIWFTDGTFVLPPNQYIYGEQKHKTGVNGGSNLKEQMKIIMR
jgi:hypothetical protein